jgi:hypothetical protein
MQVEEKKAIVTDFLMKANHYALDKIRGYGEALERETDADLRLALCDKIAHWAAYQAFNAYTIEELKTTEIDDWF